MYTQTLKNGFPVLQHWISNCGRGPSRVPRRGIQAGGGNKNATERLAQIRSRIRRIRRPARLHDTLTQKPRNKNKVQLDASDRLLGSHLNNSEATVFCSFHAGLLPARRFCTTTAGKIDFRAATLWRCLHSCTSMYCSSCSSTSMQWWYNNNTSQCSKNTLKLHVCSSYGSKIYFNFTREDLKHCV